MNAPRSKIQIEDELNLLIGDNLIDEVKNYFNNLQTEDEKTKAFDFILDRDMEMASIIFYVGNASHTAFPK